MLDIDFCAEKGTIKFPFLLLDKATATRFRNLLLFEQTFPTKKNYFGASVLFWDGLIDNPQNVDFLEKSGILENRLRSSELAADLFNNLGTINMVDANSNYLARLMSSVKDYCSFYKHHWSASLLQNHLSSPWATLALSAGLFATVLAVIQIVFGILSYYNDVKDNKKS